MALWTMYWLLTEVVEVVFYVWPLSLFLALNAIAAVACSGIPTSVSRLFALATLFMWPPLIIAVAGACWYTGPRMSASAVPTIGVTVIFGIQVLLSLGITYTLAGNRWVAIAISLIAVWLGLISWFMAGMALTNVWI